MNELIPERTYEELAIIAQDLLHGHIFTDRHLHEDPEMLPSVFMMMVFLASEHLAELQANPPGLIYEYISQAGERSVNGYPMFMSMNMLSRGDTEKVFEMMRKLKAAEQAALARPTS